MVQLLVSPKKIIAEIIQEIPEEKVSYVITNEAGASVYSASELGLKSSLTSMSDSVLPHLLQDVFRIHWQNL